MRYNAPIALNDALMLLHELEGEKVVLLAGGTDVVPRRNCIPEKSGWIKNGTYRKPLENIIFLGKLNLSYIIKETKTIRIGACTTLSEILDNPIITYSLPVLAEAISNIAGLTIRNVATLGGNIMNASPAADSIPALIAIDAQLVLASLGGERIINVSEFFIGPGETDIKKDEILKEIIVPIYAGKAKFIKFGRRKAESLSLVNGCGRFVIDNGRCIEARLAVGAVGPVPLRLLEVEEMLNGQVITNELIAKSAELAVEIISPIDDKRTTALYRKKLTKVLVERLIKESCTL